MTDVNPVNQGNVMSSYVLLMFDINKQTKT